VAAVGSEIGNLLRGFGNAEDNLSDGLIEGGQGRTSP
jgi:hypothetical protein